ncbi:Immunoglobulin I-set domain [Popillia japonica]|uniref:Immunoglobulin I-set domain n=1 Tax=Popillia japonica TaxID=7064 RepID=A0AAW1M2B0_POPJA
MLKKYVYATVTTNLSSEYEEDYDDHLRFLFTVYATVTTNLSSEYEEDYDDHDYDDYTDINTTPNGTLQFLRELTNVTKTAGDTVKLRCEIKNSDPNSSNTQVTVRWFMDFAQITQQMNKKIKVFTKYKEAGVTTSYIKIKSLETTDTGIYGCVATVPNGDKIKSEGILNVTNKWGPTGSGSSSDVSSKKPSFEEIRDGDITTFIPSIDDTNKKDPFSPFTNVVLPSIEKQTVNNPDLFEKAAESVPTYNSSQPFCQRYTGKTCQLYLESQFVFIQPPYTQKAIEENLENAVLVVSQSNEISEACRKFVLPSLCFSAFPVCSNAQQRICKEECFLLETEICSREYAIAKRHPIISKVLDLEECANLPDENEKSALNCLKLGLDRTNIEEDDTCFWSKGDSYRGVHDTSISGSKCLRWSRQFHIPLTWSKGDSYRGVHDTSISGSKCLRWSRQFHIPLTDYPELIGHAYCRNPGVTEAEPYCFIEPNKKETCGLTKCFNILLMYVLGSLVGLILVSALMITLYCYRKKNKMRNIQNLNLPPVDKNIYGNGGPSSPIELNTLLPPNAGSTRSQNNKNCFQNIPNYTYKEVTFVDELGEGAFGKVYKGELKTKTGKIFVAVKSLKENASAKTQADFQREIELISELKHPNIICLMGIVVKQEPMCMLFEYMSEGDLHEFLINNSPNNGKSLTQFQFLHIAIQIAQGMEYLSDNQ